MPFLKRTYTDILDGARAYFNENGSTAVDVAGTPEHAMTRLAATEIAGIYNSIDYMRSGLLLSTASGDDLDLIAEGVGLSRGQAVPAMDVSGSNVKFFINPQYNKTAAELAASISQPSLVIPKGTRISDGGNIEYYVSEDATFGSFTDADGNQITESTFVNVIASYPGDDYNVNAGDLRVHNLASSDTLGPIAKYIEVTNLLPITNGSTTESDQDFRYRISTAFTANAQGNLTAVLAAARGVPGVADATVVDHLYGTGTFGVFIDTVTPLISPGIIKTVQAAVDNVKAAGVKAYVMYPNYMGLQLTIDVMFYDQGKKEETITLIRNGLINYINNLSRGETLRINKLNGIINNPSNVQNAEITKIRTGAYDVSTQTITNSMELLLVDQATGLKNKWFTASALLDICDVGANT